MAHEPTQSKVLVYRTFGHLTAGGSHWQGVVQGKAYSTGPFSLRQRLVLGLLRKVMKASTADFASPVFLARVREFLCRPEKGRRLLVRVGQAARSMETVTRSSGHFTCRVSLRADEVRAWQRGKSGSGNWLNVAVSDALSGQDCGRGQMQLLEPTGISVISDIDDTLKHTAVTSRREMLANTFLREFERIPGMAEVFQQWQRQGAAFHYVSSSPWQLFPALVEHFAAARFPEGDFHLRQFQLRSDVIRKLLLLRRPTKKRIIAGIVAAFPRRQFVLVGDSAEHDPEIYAAVARKFPDRIARIHIRMVPPRGLPQARLVKTFRKLAPNLVHLYESADELGDLRPLCSTAP